MKVLVVGTGGSLSGSGITTAADQMVRTLELTSHEATRLIAGARPRKHPNRLNTENVVAVLREAVALARATRRSGADVVWLHTMGVPTLPAIRALVQVLAVRGMGCRIIVEFHAFGIAHQVARAGVLERMVLRMLARLSERVVALHASDAQALRSHVREGKLVVLPNWVDVPDEPKPLPPSPPFRIVFVGSLVARKGVPQLLEAVRLLDEAPACLRVIGGAGDDGEAAAAAMVDAASDLVESGSVTFLGQLDAARVRLELGNAHLFVLPSAAEGMPMAMLEALAEGRPVIVSDAGNMAEIVRDTGCGEVLSSTDPGVIAEAVRNAMADPPRLAGQGRAGHRAAVERFSDATAAEALERILSVVSPPHRGAV